MTMDYEFECTTCTEKAQVKVSMIVPHGKLSKKGDLVLQFLRKHYHCDTTEQYRELIRTISSPLTKQKAKMILDLIDQGVESSEAFKIYREFYK